MAKVKADPQAWIRVIDRMLKDNSYNYASDTLEGIRETIDSNGKVSGGQITAIQNIRRGADRI